MTKHERAIRDEQIAKNYINGATLKTLMDEFDMSMSGVRLCLTRFGALTPLSHDDRDSRDKAMREYKAQGYTMSDVANKFGVSEMTAQRVCKGIAPQDTATRFAKGCVPSYKTPLKDETAVAQFIADRVPYEYAGNYTGCDGRADLKCKTCGTVFNRSMISIRKGNVACPTCMAAEAERRAKAKALAIKEREAEAELLKAERDRAKAERLAERERIRLERIHPCPVCGNETDRPKYCSKRCAQKVANSHGELRRRNLLKTAMIDKDITVDGLYIRDKGVCAICGGQCDYEDYTVRNGFKICGDWYPSVDHVIPLAKGGKHSWNNVQLAHRRCNWEKSDNI